MIHQLFCTAESTAGGSWSTLRPADVQLDSEGFVAKLTRSKTIGSDRAVTMRFLCDQQGCSYPDLELDVDGMAAVG